MQGHSNISGCREGRGGKGGQENSVVVLLLHLEQCVPVINIEPEQHNS